MYTTYLTKKDDKINLKCSNYEYTPVICSVGLDRWPQITHCLLLYGNYTRFSICIKIMYIKYFFIHSYIPKDQSRIRGMD